MTKLGDLSNDELIARLRAHVGRGNVWLVGLLSYLAEVDARRLYAEHACTSMWDFCVRRLGMSEGEANRRIAAARVVRRFPLAHGYLERGEIHLCAVYEMHKHLTAENHEELFREASGKSTKAVAEMIAARFPKPDVHACVEPLAAQAALAVATTGLPPSDAAALPPVTAQQMVRPKVAPLSATRYRVELSVSTETKAKLERIKDLMRHRNPTGDLERIFDASLDLLLVKLERERLGKTSRPKEKKRSPSTAREPAACAPPARHRLDANSLDETEGAGTPPRAESLARAVASPNERVAPLGSTANEPPLGTAAAATLATVAKVAMAAKLADGAMQKTRRRHIPTAVRREVFARDGEQCTYVDAEGNRCPARGYLELDHVHAKALGGSDEAANLRVRCRLHNRWHAEQVFGREYIEERIHVRHRKCARPSASPAPSFEAAARGLRSLGFREPDVRAAMARLPTMLDSAAPTESILLEALRLLT